MTDWERIVRAIRSGKLKQPSRRLAFAFERALQDAHTRGRVYATMGEKWSPVTEFHETEEAAYRLLVANLRITPPRRADAARP